MKNTLLFAIFFLPVLCFSQNSKNVDASTFKKLMDEKKYVLVDLRTTAEIEKKGMIKGALQIDYFAKDAEAQIAGLDKNKSYLLYCAGGGRSSECATLMQKLGFTNLVNLERGFDDWKAKGYETVKR